jgi:hypothetical protein
LAIRLQSAECDHIRHYHSCSGDPSLFISPHLPASRRPPVPETTRSILCPCRFG